jgi:hypothetical protein
MFTVVTEVDRGACVNRFLEGECNVLSAPKAVSLRSRVDDPPNQTIVGISRRIPTGRHLSPSRVTFPQSKTRKAGREGTRLVGELTLSWLIRSSFYTELGFVALGSLRKTLLRPRALICSQYQCLSGNRLPRLYPQSPWQDGRRGSYVGFQR